METNNLTTFKAKVEKELEFFFDKEIKKALLISDYSRMAIELLKDYTLRGGKRIRAMLVYYGYKCFKEDDKNIKDIVKIAASIELVQSYLLIHDDFIDQDELRRGKATVHSHYRKTHKEFENASHFGASMAIIIGDIACSYANRIISESNLDDKTKTSIIKRLNYIIYEVCQGELLDIISNYKELTEDELFKISELKTASYTFKGPLQIGAMIAKAKPKEIEKLDRYSLLVGKAFQFHDDFLGIFGDEKITGKSAASDLKSGKITLLIKKALRKANEKDRKALKKILKDRKITNKELETVKKIIYNTGALDEIKEITKKMVSDAKKIILKSKFKKQGKEFLINLAEFTIGREK
jgi:geranylgeranyl diphosphate synthase, type I